MGLAITGVMLSHILNHTAQPYILAQLSRLIHTPGFLFLSGFGLYYSFQRNDNVIQFWNKRLKRIYIPYLMYSSWLFLILFLFRKCTLLQLGGYITTLSYWFEGNYYAMWYIPISILLYFLFPLFYKLINNNLNKLGGLVVSLAILIAISVVVACLYPSYWERICIGVYNMPIFPIGIFAGYLSNQNYKVGGILLLSILIGCTCFFAIGIYPSIARSLFGILISTILFNYIDKNFKLDWLMVGVKWLGKYSLELYIIHVTLYFFLIEIVQIVDSYSIVIGCVVSIIICIIKDKLQKK